MWHHSYRKIRPLAFILFLSILSMAQVGYLHVMNPSSLSVFVDSTFISDSSFQNLMLPPGEHTVYAYNRRNASWLNRSYEKKIVIEADQQTTLHIKTNQYFYLNSNPFGSLVFYQDSLLGTTPILLSSRDFNRKTLTLKQKGYSDQTVLITDTPEAYFIDLNSSDNKHELSYVIKGDNKDSGRRWYREGLAVTSILSGWTAFYFKRQADHYYADYEKAADPKTITRLYEKTRTYDLYSEIALTVSVTTLATYLWFLIKE
jgi:hypothetical protein